MSTKGELLAGEQRAWEVLHAAVHAVDQQTAEIAYSDDWSVKDCVAHVACWQAEAATMLAQMRQGTYEGWEEGAEDEINARFQESCRTLSWDEVLAQIHAGRSRMLEELDLLPERLLDAEAESWFVESGAEHYEEHLADLRRVLPR